MNNDIKKELLEELKKNKQRIIIELEVVRDYNRSILFGISDEAEENKIRKAIESQEQQIRVNTGLISKIEEKISKLNV